MHGLKSCAASALTGKRPNGAATGWLRRAFMTSLRKKESSPVRQRHTGVQHHDQDGPDHVNRQFLARINNQPVD